MTIIKKLFYRRFYELSKLLPSLPKEKGFDLYKEIVGDYMRRPLSKTPIDEIDANDSEVTEFLNFFDFRMKFTRMVNLIDENQELSKEIDEQLLDEKIIKNFVIETFIRPELFNQPKEANETLNPVTKERKETLEKLVSGTYHWKDGKLLPGKGEQRIPSIHSNWNAGNADPQDIEKHKELLDRQHFSGPFWKEKIIPKSVEEEMPQYNPLEVEEEFGVIDPTQLEEGSHDFKKVKG